MTKPHPVTADARLNPTLAGEIAGLRGGMLAAAEARPCPERFEFEKHPDGPRLTIRDRETGRTSEIPLAAYGYARGILGDLFA